jgi:hypothetical protein
MIMALLVASKREKKIKKSSDPITKDKLISVKKN